MDQNLKEIMKQEAVQRMEVLFIMPNVVKKFTNDRIVYYSETVGENMCGILFYLSNYPKWMEQINKFENKTGYLVYHAVLTHFIFGDILDLL